MDRQSLFKIKVKNPAEEPGKQREQKKTIRGEIVCDGIFGIYEHPAEGWLIVHINTGYTAGHYASYDDAFSAAKELAQLDLPWSAKKKSEWNKGRSEAESEKAVAIIEKHWGYQ